MQRDDPGKPILIGAAEVLRLIAEHPSFALIRHEDSDVVDVLFGRVHEVQRLADVPLRTHGPAGPDVLLLVPHRQVAERGFVAHDDGAALLCLIVERNVQVSVADFVRHCPGPALVLRGDMAYDLDDEEYGNVVRRIVEEEIGRGEGANFVIARTLQAHIEDWSTARALAVFRNLLVHEHGAYWTFCVQTPERTLIGASPERHISKRGRTVTMNPISGTFRMPAEDLSDADLRERLLNFLQDEKETLELMMVVDEELKVMAALCPEGGRVIGPFLKPMSHLVHTEYMLEGESSLDPRELLSRSMFAATVLGSPVENACRVVHRYEATGRGYYGAVLAEIGRDGEGQAVLDAPILIRTADIRRDGSVQMSVGATLVRDSVPKEEVAETKAKIAGLLAALTTKPTPRRPLRRPVHCLFPVEDPNLRARNARLSPFWLNKSPQLTSYPDLVGVAVELVSAEDDFANMLAHMLRSLGVAVQQRSWRDQAGLDTSEADVLLVGPGPGDPRSRESPRMAVLRRLVADCLAAQRPLVGVCLGHQILADALKLELRPKRTVVQGAQVKVDLFGRPELVGFYNTFTAILPDAPDALSFVCAAHDGEVIALRGPGYAGLQFHAESVLTPRGRDILAETLRAALGSLPKPQSATDEACETASSLS